MTTTLVSRPTTSKDAEPGVLSTWPLAQRDHDIARAGISALEYARRCAADAPYTMREYRFGEYIVFAVCWDSAHELYKKTIGS